jgi:excisionase family DNA binding protein
MGISLGQAARQLKISKGTLSKAISSGKLSATRNTDSSWSIDPAELQRYWNEHGHRFSRSETVENDQPETAPATDDLVAALRETIALLKAANASLEHDRDEWREQAKRLALPAQKPQETAQATPTDAPATGEGTQQDPVTESLGARKRSFWFESNPPWRWNWRRRAG